MKKNMKKLQMPDRGTAVRTAALFIITINQTMVLLGKQPLPFTDDEIYQAVSAAASAMVSLWVWWKNNSFTAAAKSGDAVMKQIKSD